MEGILNMEGFFVANGGALVGMAWSSWDPGCGTTDLGNSMCTRFQESRSYALLLRASKLLTPLL
eukprot:12933861-Prorocentrum_lima.AAC.1